MIKAHLQAGILTVILEREDCRIWLSSLGNEPADGDALPFQELSRHGCADGFMPGRQNGIAFPDRKRAGILFISVPDAAKALFPFDHIAAAAGAFSDRRCLDLVRQADRGRRFEQHPREHHTLRLVWRLVSLV